MNQSTEYETLINQVESCYKNPHLTQKIEVFLKIIKVHFGNIKHLKRQDDVVGKALPLLFRTFFY